MVRPIPASSSTRSYAGKPACNTSIKGSTARGEMLNRIEECQLDLFADRTSATTMSANQLWLWFASRAYVL